MRRRAREIVFQLLFQYSFTREKDDVNFSLMMQDSNLDSDDKNYIENTIGGVIENEQNLSKIIEANLTGYTIDRIYKPDYVILLLATYELTQKIVPVPVIVNEAVTIAKKFGTDNSSKFVNGVLAKIVKDLENK